MNFNPLTWFSSNEEEPTSGYTGNVVGNDGVAFRGFTGEKFDGGLTDARNELNSIYANEIDYPALRSLSAKLYHTNMYAKGLIHRAIAITLSGGLRPEAQPNSDVLDVDVNKLVTLAENIDNHFELYATTPTMVSTTGDLTFSQIQELAMRESLIGGDCLVVLKYAQGTGIPSVKIVPAHAIQSPIFKVNIIKGHKIVDGVEVNSQGVIVAHWVKSVSGKINRIATHTRRTKRLLSYMIYSGDKRAGELRGTPILGVVAQSLSDLDTYRDNIIRKAVTNSSIAAAITRDKEGPSTKPYSGIQGNDNQNPVTETHDMADGRKFGVSNTSAGVVFQTLAPGEKVDLLSNSSSQQDISEFEKGILSAIAWHIGLSPEVLQMSFNSNFSSAMGASTESSLEVEIKRKHFSDNFCKPVYQEWLISMSNTQKITIPGLAESQNDISKLTFFAAYTHSTWHCMQKPPIDALRQVKAYKMMIDNGLMTRSQATRNISGTDYYANLKRMKHENAAYVEVQRPLMEFKQEFSLTDESESVAINQQDEILLLLEELTDV